MRANPTISEERKREILANLQRERELRRKQAQQLYSQSYSQSQQESPIEDYTPVNADDFKDPREILMGNNEDPSAHYEEINCDEQRPLSVNMQNQGNSVLQKNQYRSNSINAMNNFQAFTINDYSMLPAPQELPVQPKRSPIQKSSTGASFAFDKDSKIAQEIKRKYSAKPVVSPMYERNTVAAEARLAKHDSTSIRTRQFNPQKKPPLNHPPTYMKPTALSGLRNCKDVNKLPEKVRKVALEQQEKFKMDCTFKPEITVSTFDSKLELNKRERLTRLYKPRTTEMQKREKIKRQKEDEEFSNVCTFQPKRYTQSASSLCIKGKEEYNKPIEERLLTDASKRIENIRNGYRDKAQRELKECTFQPDTSLSSKNVRGPRTTERPIYERAKDIQREREESLQRKRMEAEQKDTNLTFKPKVIKKSHQVLMNRSDIMGQSVTERLYKDAADRIEKNAKQSEILSQQQSVQYPFNPRLYNSTYSLNGLSEDRLLSKGFKERQELYLQKKKEKEEQNASKYSLEARCTFKPAINFTSEILVEADPKRGNETDHERLHRLSKKDPKYHEQIKKIKEQEVDSKYTYHPKINENSRMMALNRSMESSKSFDKGKTNRERQLELAFEQQQQECTFQPKINSKNVPSYYSKNEDILMVIKEKERARALKREQQKRDLEYEEMKGCTFQPAVSNYTGKAGSAVIRGLGRHLELQEKKKQLEKERRDRENQVFNLAEKYDQREIHDTIPQPFKLSQRNPKLNHNRRSSGDTKGYPFHPETIEGKNRKFLKELVNRQMPEEYCMNAHD